MGNTDFETLGQALVAVAFAVVGAYRLYVGHKKSDSKPPEHRPPSPAEIRVACEGLQQTLDRLSGKLERHIEVTNDDMRDVQRQLDRIESATRLCSAMSDIDRKYGRR